MTDTIKAALVETYLGALRDADPAALDGVLAPDFTFTLPQPALNQPTMTRSDAISFLTTVPGSFLETRTITFEKVNVVETPTDYVAELRVRADLKKGGVYDNLYVLWFRIAHGKIQLCREHADTAYVRDVAA